MASTKQFNILFLATLQVAKEASEFNKIERYSVEPFVNSEEDVYLISNSHFEFELNC